MPACVCPDSRPYPLLALPSILCAQYDNLLVGQAGADAGGAGHVGLILHTAAAAPTAAAATAQCSRCFVKA
jgi:hypothetical protein